MLKLFASYKIKKTLLLALFFVFYTPFLFSQNTSNLNPKKNPGQYILKSWNTENGLSSESANDIIQTEDGYIWIGTYTGLHRFDGNKFTLFTAQNSSLPSSNVLRMDIDSSGVLWLGTLHGVCYIENDNFIIPEALKSIKDFSIEAILTTKNNDLWFSTKSNQLFLYSNSKLKNLTEKFGVTKSTVLTIAESQNGTIYIGTDDSKLFQYSDKQVEEIFFNEEINGINKIITFKNQVFLGTGKGLYTLKNNIPNKDPIFQNTSVTSLIVEQSGILWLGTMRGLFRYQPDIQQIDSLTEARGLPNNIIRDLLFDKSGNLWGATYRNGFFFLSDGAITSYTQNDGLGSEIITGVTEKEINSYILGEESGGLYLLKNDLILKYKPEIPLPNARLKHLFTDDKQRIWASTYNGLVLLDGKNSRYYNINTGFPDNFIRQVYQDRSGNIWVGTKNAGLIKFNNLNSWDVIDTDKGMSSNYIMSIAENNKNQLIIGTISGINIIDKMEVVKTITIEDGLPSNFLFSTYPTDNYLWIASNDGLIGYSQEKIVVFNTENGLPSNIIYNIVGDKKGNFWLPSEKAILKVNIKELENAAKFPDSIINVYQFDKSHGMKNNHCLGGVHSFSDNDGNFWVPTLGGIVYINNDKFEVEKPNINLIIESVFADNKTITFSDKALIPARTNRLNIVFTGIDYKNSDNLQFRYKLIPFDKNWIETTSDRNALYTNLPPGEYEFLLQAGLNNSFFSYSKKIQIQIEAAWRQTLWAKILFVLFIMSIGLITYLIRVRSLTLKNKKLESMVRTRTAKLEEQKQELSAALTNLSEAQEQVVQSDKMASLGILSAGVAHEMNNPLNFIQGGLFGLEAYYEENENEPPEHISALLNAIKEGVSRATSIVSSLNEFSHQGKNTEEECQIHHIIENCLVMLQNKLKTKIELIKEFDTSNPIVIGSSGKLHQAFLNIITNAIQAINNTGTITIKTQIRKKYLVVLIKDTGRGINPENIKKITEPFYTTKAPGEGTGLGLSITYTIINEHGGKLSFSSKAGQGTTASINLPIKN